MELPTCTNINIWLNIKKTILKFASKTITMPLFMLLTGVTLEYFAKLVVTSLIWPCPSAQSSASRRWRQHNVVQTSMWRHDITSTLMRRCFDFMYLLGWYHILCFNSVSLFLCICMNCCYLCFAYTKHYSILFLICVPWLCPCWPQSLFIQQ